MKHSRHSINVPPYPSLPPALSSSHSSQHSEWRKSAKSGVLGTVRLTEQYLQRTWFSPQLSVASGLKDHLHSSSPMCADIYTCLHMLISCCISTHMCMDIYTCLHVLISCCISTHMCMNIYTCLHMLISCCISTCMCASVTKSLCKIIYLSPWVFGFIPLKKVTLTISEH